MASVIRRVSFVCGLAAGAIIATKGLNYLEEKAQTAQDYLSNPIYRDSDFELVLVQVLFRHGARTPLRLLPGIEEATWDKSELLRRLPHTDIDVIVKDLKNRVLPREDLNDALLKGGSTMGQLTVVGQQETYELGKRLKQLYVNKLGFLDQRFDPNNVFLRTTHIPRTIDSLRCFVAGMFQNAKEPVSFWTVPIEEEILFPNWQYKNTALRQYIRYCLRNAHKLDGYQQDMETFFNIVGQRVHRLTFIDIIDNLNCRKAHNKEFPAKLQQFMATIEKRSVQIFKEAFLNPPQWTNDLILPLAVGSFVGTLLQNIQNCVAKTSPYKLCLFSVHDTSLFVMLCAFGVGVEKWPPFASYVTLELYKNKSAEYFVQILYNGKILKLKDSKEGLMSLPQFERLASRYYIEDLESAHRTVFHPPKSS